MLSDYELVDSGDCSKIERFGNFVLKRPCDIAIWPLKSNIKIDANFYRKHGDMEWKIARRLPDSWMIDVHGVQVTLKCTEFGHVGLFYEHSELWNSHKELYSKVKNRTPKILNLFAYTGVGSIKMAMDGCDVTHVDSSKAAINWANGNAKLNDVSNIRWIFEDVMKFMRREARRNSSYDGIILDPPSFGRGAKGEVFKVERNLWELLELCKQCLSKKSDAFITLSSHSEGFSEHLLSSCWNKIFKNREGKNVNGVLFLGKEDNKLPSGYYSTWIND
ncbi:MAG: class I SAM-dependent methyltransferase [Chlamydiia bacterium]|nr:class I SAM-dependent methyltransferase [Chlamydiia bacterium]